MLLTEGKAAISIPSAAVRRSAPVFYNPVMKHNRDVAVLLLKSIPDRALRVCMPLEASGVRGIRFLKELPKSKIASLQMNDNRQAAAQAMRRNLQRNRVKATVSCADASLVMLQGTGFDYIDIDPFGSPNPFLDAAVRSLTRKGILAVSATDTACLCGACTKPCLRKYWSTPSHTHGMHELGLRILIRKAQLVAAQYDRALLPMYCYSKDHYLRCYFRAAKSKRAVDSVLEQHGRHGLAGPLWLGQLWDSSLAERIAQHAPGDAFLATIAQESHIPSVGFIELHELARKCHQDAIPTGEAVTILKKAGFHASRTHFSPTGIRTAADERQCLRAFSRWRAARR